VRLKSCFAFRATKNSFLGRAIDSPLAVAPTSGYASLPVSSEIEEALPVDKDLGKYRVDLMATEDSDEVKASDLSTEADEVFPDVPAKLNISFQDDIGIRLNGNFTLISSFIIFAVSMTNYCER
jgi:hypothetical protein